MADPALVFFKKGVYSFGFRRYPTAPKPKRIVPRKSKSPGERQGGPLMVPGSLPFLKTLCMPPMGKGFTT